MKILPPMHLWTRKSRVHFGSYPNPFRIRTSDSDQIRRGKICALQVLLFIAVLNTWRGRRTPRSHPKIYRGVPPPPPAAPLHTAILICRYIPSTV